MCSASLEMTGSGFAAQGSNPAHRHSIGSWDSPSMLAPFAYRRPVHADTAEENALIAELGGRRVTCSPRGLLTSHCIVLCHHALDTVGEAPRGGAREG